MDTSRKTEIAPLFEAFGAAVFEGQHLEHGLGLLLVLINYVLKAQGKAAARLTVDSPAAPKTIGKLFEEVQVFEYLTEAERKLIQKGVRSRNVLVHSYWKNERIAATTTPAGRKWLLQDLNRIRQDCRKAGRLVDSFIDEYLAKAGTSLDKLSRPLWDKWQSDTEVPPEVLH